MPAYWRKLLVRPFAELFEVSYGGMLPTFEGGDRIVVDKVTYRFREPERRDVIGGVYRVAEDDLQRYIEAHRIQPEDA